jgi:two-component SAPR family response regulator
VQVPQKHTTPLQIRIVLLSALDETHSQPADLRADEFLAKPVKAEDLIACVERLLLTPA